MIEFQNVSFSYRDQKIFEDLNFSLVDFTSTALLGLNGEGKTTMLKLLLGLLKPEKGKILIDGIDISTLSEEKRSRLLSYVPQQIEDPLNMSVLDFVCMGKISRRSFFKGPDESEKEEVRTLLKELQCGDLIARDLSALSFGQKRLIYLARAIYQDADVLVMDEPVSSLDFLKQHDLLSFLKDHLKRHNKKLIFSIHDPCLAYEYADSFLFFKEHRLFDAVSKKNKDHIDALRKDIASLYENRVCVRFDRDRIYMDLLDEGTVD